MSSSHIADKGFPATKTYYGLEKIVVRLRDSLQWTSLTHREEWEFLLGAVYFGFDSAEMLRRCETNDYLRRALKRNSPLPRNVEDVTLIQNTHDSLVLKSLCEKNRLAPERTVLIGKSKGAIGVVYEKALNGTIGRFYYKESYVSVDDTYDLHTLELKSFADWINDPSSFDFLEEGLLKCLKIILINSILEIGQDLNFPEFNALKEKFFGDDLLSDLEKNGYVVIKNFLSEHEISVLRDTTYRLAKDESTSGAGYFYGKDNSMQRVYGLIAKDDCFAKLFLCRSEIFEILSYFFGSSNFHQPFYLSSFQANVLYPGAPAQVLHVDSSVPDPLPPWKIRLNINLNLDEFTEDNGSTLVWPESHKFLRKPTNKDANPAMMCKLLAPAGSLIIWTGHLWHQGGENRAATPRAALLACFAASYLREIVAEENYLRVMGHDAVARQPEEMRLLVGYNHGLKLPF